MDARCVAVLAVGMLYRQAEEEAADLRRRIRERRARLQRRERRLALLAYLVNKKKQPMQRYAQMNINVPIISMFMSGADTKPALRLSRDSLDIFFQMLPHNKSHGWSHEVEVLVTVYWLACGASYRVTADIFDMPLSTICRIVHKTVDNMMTIIHQVIHFPKHEELEVVGSGFARLADHEAFGRAVGAIDGCHIRVLPPKDPQKRCYMNRKLFPSVILQGVCDAGVKFLDVYIGNPGLVHDSMVLRRSPMFRQALYPPAGYFLLGDGGYPCLQHPVAIMTPYRQPVATRVESRFNHHHAKARIIIERTFGMLKTRWRIIFLRALEVRPLFTPKVIGACCILHNICMGVGDIVEEEDDDGSEDGGNSEDEAPGGVVSTPPVVAVVFAATTRGGVIECCPWSAASMALSHGHTTSLHPSTSGRMSELLKNL
ncbi:uncharacterized protein LOC131443306 [Solea solea]|uniref:uncharacterized protein LOC131443306 n=1 Tax=Solea solea TaxID=90069 RepID=UPI00272CC080|nr:uncharacterized protein LOC131443306 [Solea solea]